MFSITGKIKNIFTQPGGKGKDGTAYPEQTKVQIEGMVTLNNGESKIELLTLTVPPKLISTVIAQRDCDVTLPCGIFASGNKITPFLTA